MHWIWERAFNPQNAEKFPPKSALTLQIVQKTRALNRLKKGAAAALCINEEK